VDVDSRELIVELLHSLGFLPLEVNFSEARQSVVLTGISDEFDLIQDKAPPMYIITVVKSVDEKGLPEYTRRVSRV